MRVARGAQRWARRGAHAGGDKEVGLEVCAEGGGEGVDGPQLGGVGGHKRRLADGVDAAGAKAPEGGDGARPGAGDTGDSIVGRGRGGVEADGHG